MQPIVVETEHFAVSVVASSVDSAASSVPTC
jgi:hypothetical protein